MDLPFERALLKIHHRLRVDAFRFVPILNGHKKPEGARWSTEANYPYNHAVMAGYLAEGHNFGVLTGVGGLVVLDIDDLARLEALGIVCKLPDTFTVRTGRGGLHFYLLCPELREKIILEDPEMIDNDGDPLHLGELQALGQQVVGPGSRHPNGNRYEVVKDLPIAAITKAELIQILEPLKQSSAAEVEEKRTSRRRSSGGSSIGDLIPIDQVAWPKDIKERSGAEVRGSHPLHGSDSGKNFAVNTAKNCWHCFRHKSGGGPLEWLAVEAGLISCQDAKPGCLDKESFKAVLQIARDRGFDIPAPEKREEPKAKEPNVLTALQKLLDNEDRIKGESLWNWRTNKPRIERTLKDGYLSRSGEEKAHKFLKQFKEVLKDLNIDYFDLQPLLLKPKDNREEFSEEIKEKALEVLKNGNPVQFVADACGRIVLGAETAFKKLSSCVSVQNIRQSAGLHPKFSGDSGGGKTFISYTFAHHLPQEAVIKGSMSAKSGFYHKDGNRVLRLLDDYQNGNEDLDTTIKQTTSDFHSPYQHRTLIKQVAATLEIGSEQTWLVTSVDTSQDIQVINRQLPINVDDSVGLTKKVNDRTIERYGKAEEQRPTDETVLICRAMFQILRDEGYIDVAVPFWERIEWIDNSNRRNPAIFMDLVIAHTAMNRYQREKDPKGRYLATEDDFQAAKALFNDNDAEELVKRLTRRERDVIEKLVANQNGYTRDELAELLKVAPERISQIIGGQKGNGGLKQKVQIAETRKSETITVNKDTADEKRVTIHKIVFSLAQYDKWSGFDGVVKLIPAPVEPDKPDKHQVSNPVSNSNDSSKNPVSKVSKERKERKIEEERDLPGSSSVEDCSYLENEKKAYHAYAVEPDSESKANQVLTGSLPGEYTRQRVKFRTDYDTDLDGEMRHLIPGDMVEVSPDRATAWIKRGVAEAT